MENTEIDIKELCVDAVEVYSWCHSGPVAVDLKGVSLEILVKRLNETGKVKAEIIVDDSD